MKAALILFVGLFFACDDNPTTRVPSAVPLTEEELEPYQTCNSNSTCTEVANGCCQSCNDTAINSDHEDEFDASFDCSGVACTASLEPCVTAQAVCDEDAGQCVLIETGPE